MARTGPENDTHNFLLLSSLSSKANDFDLFCVPLWVNSLRFLHLVCFLFLCSIVYSLFLLLPRSHLTTSFDLHSFVFLYVILLISSLHHSVTPNRFFSSCLRRRVQSRFGLILLRNFTCTGFTSPNEQYHVSPSNPKKNTQRWKATTEHARTWFCQQKQTDRGVERARNFTTRSESVATHTPDALRTRSPSATTKRAQLTNGNKAGFDTTADAGCHDSRRNAPEHLFTTNTDMTASTG